MYSYKRIHECITICNSQLKKEVYALLYVVHTYPHKLNYEGLTSLTQHFSKKRLLKVCARE